MSGELKRIFGRNAGIAALAMVVLFGRGQGGFDAPRQQKAGSITGKVVVPEQVQAGKRERPSRYRVSSAGTSVGDSKEQKPEVTNVVVYLEGEGLENAQPASVPAPLLDQRDATFIPHVLPVLKGTTVRIVNRDKTYHNVFSLSGVKKFNIGRRPTGEEVPVTFDKPGVVQVFCDIHSHMSAFVLVLDSPIFTRPGDDGAFTLANIPAGQYTVQVWHERFSGSPQKVTVKAGERISVNFTLQ